MSNLFFSVKMFLKNEDTMVDESIDWIEKVFQLATVTK